MRQGLGFGLLAQGQGRLRPILAGRSRRAKMRCEGRSAPREGVKMGMAGERVRDFGEDAVASGTKKMRARWRFRLLLQE